MERSATILLALLVLSSALAIYVRQTKGSESTPDASVFVWKVSQDEATSFSFRNDNFQVELTPKIDDFGRFWTAQTTRKIPQTRLKQKNHKFGEVDRDTTIVVEDKELQTRIKHFVVGRKGRSFLENLLPLRAKSIISNTDGREDEFGLSENAGRFTIETDEEKRNYEIGYSGYGSKVRYIKSEGADIFALDERIYNAMLEADTKLEGNIVFAPEIDDLLSFTVKNRNRSLIMKHKRRGDSSYWTLNDDENASSPVKSWVETKLLTMTSTGFVPDALKPKQLEILLEFEMNIRDVDQKISGTFFKKNSAIRPIYFVKTDLTRGLVKMKPRQVLDLIASLRTLE